MVQPLLLHVGSRKVTLLASILPHRSPGLLLKTHKPSNILINRLPICTEPHAALHLTYIFSSRLNLQSLERSGKTILVPDAIFVEDQVNSSRF